MGVDTNLHIGPYMIVKGKKEVTIEERILTCSNTKCPSYKGNVIKKGKHCDECGSPISEKSYSIKETIQAKNFENEDFLDELMSVDPMCGNSNIFISMENSPFDKRVEVEDEAFDLSNVDIQKEIDWFKNKHKNIIDYITNEFGEKSVNVKWGVIQWYS